MKKLKILAVILSFVITATFASTMVFAQTTTNGLSKPEIIVLSNSSSIKVTWHKVKNATGYEIYRSKSKNGYFKKVHICNSGKVSYWMNKSLRKNKKYFFKVKAFSKSTGDITRSEFSNSGFAKATDDPYFNSGFTNEKDVVGLSEFTVYYANYSTRSLIIDGTEALYYLGNDDDNTVDDGNSGIIDNSDDYIDGDGIFYLKTASNTNTNSPASVTVKPGETVKLTWCTNGPVQDFVNDSSCIEILLKFKKQDYTLTISNNADYQDVELTDNGEDDPDA